MDTKESSKILAKKTTKDSVFRDLFEIPKYLLQLYEALHPEDTKVTEADLGNVTIKNVLLDQMYNDLGFTVGSRLMILVEAQSTWSVNIIIRALMYLANTWQEYIQNNKLNVYKSTKIHLPKPELYVIYTGNRKSRPDLITLQDEFFNGEKTCVNVEVKVLYDGKKGDIINQYVTFTKVYNEQVKLYGRTREAIMETIRICKEQNVLVDYFKERESEVVDIMMTLFDQEYAVERYGDEREAKGKSEGSKERAKEIAIRMSKKGFSIEDIADSVDSSIEMVKKWITLSTM